MHHLNWHGYRLAEWLGVGGLGLLFLLSFFLTELRNPLLLGAFFIVVGLFVAIHRRIPTLFGCLLVLTALMSAAGWGWELYKTITFYDEIAHGLTVFALTTVFGSYVVATFPYFVSHPWLSACFMLFFGISVGTIWELIEYFIILSNEKMTLRDTIVDISVDSLGAIFAVIIVSTKAEAISRTFLGRH